MHIRQHSGSLSTGSSAGRLFRRRLNVQSGHREVRHACPEMHQAMPRGEGNTEKVGMVTCCQEPRGRRFWIIAAAGSERRVPYWSVEAGAYWTSACGAPVHMYSAEDLAAGPRGGVGRMGERDAPKLLPWEGVFGERVSPQGATLSACMARGQRSPKTQKR